MADVSSVVSVVPFPIREKKPSLLPAEYYIPPAKPGDFEILHVERAHVILQIMEERTIRLPVLSEDIAKSIVADYCDGFLARISGEAEPGLFVVNGWPEKKEVSARYQTELEQATRKQNYWFKRLVELADDDWSRYHSHKMISDIQRYAAGSLKLDREWMLAQAIEAAASECPVCFVKVNPRAIVCSNCNFVLNEEAYAVVKGKFTTAPTVSIPAKV